MTNSDDIARSIEGHNRRNLALRDRLLQQRLVLDDPRAVELHFWSAEQRDAALVARALYQSGFLDLVLSPSQQENQSVLWNVEAGIQEPISRVLSSEFTEKRCVLLRSTHRSSTVGAPVSSKVRESASRN
jgi:hypothetical protein